MKTNITNKAATVPANLLASIFMDMQHHVLMSPRKAKTIFNIFCKPVTFTFNKVPSSQIIYIYIYNLKLLILGLF